MTAHDEGRGRSGGQELATSTLAEIYAQQGLLERARAIYERIAQRTPDDPHIAARIDALSRAIRDRSGAAKGAAVATAEPIAEDPPAVDPPGTSQRATDEVFEAWLRRR